MRHELDKIYHQLQNILITLNGIIKEYEKSDTHSGSGYILINQADLRHIAQSAKKLKTPQKAKSVKT